MTANSNGLSAWLNNLGFTEDPFGYPRAERSPKKMLQETYIYDEELAQLMLDPRQSVVFLAPYGGGKTAARQYTRFRWEDAYEQTLIAEYKDFATIANSLPTCHLKDHIDPLMQAITAAVGQRLAQEPERYMQLFELDQIWWLKIFSTYAAGGLDDLLNAHLTLEAFIYDSVAYEKLQTLRRKRPFNQNVSLSTMLKKIVTQCHHLRFDKLLILVDEVDDYSQNDEIDDMKAMLKPLFRTMSAYEFVLWKYFVPDDLQSFITKTAANRKKAIIVQPIHWKDEERLKKLLQHRLLWASDDEIGSLNEMTADDQVLALTDLDAELVQLTLTSLTYQEEMGIPRTLLHLGNMLIKEAQKQHEPLITKAVWDEFSSQATGFI